MKKYLWIILLVAVAAGFAYLGITVLTDGNNGPVLYAERLDGDEICDYYAINKKGEAVSANGYGCSSYIDCYGCTDMEITMMQMNVDSDYGLAFYDKNKNFISFVPSPEGDKQASVVKSIKVPRKAYYFRTTFFDYEKQKKYGEFACTLGFKTNTITEGKRPYQDGYIFFSQRVNQSMTEEEYKVTTGVVALPETYSQTGEKTPLLVYAHGLSHYVYYDGWGNTEEFRTQKQHWLDMGFAVLDCNGARDNNQAGTFASGICPQGVNAYKRCIDYVVKHYNVEPEIYLVAGSAGGALGWNFLDMYGDSVKAATFIAPWSDLEVCAWGGGGTATRELFVEYLGFKNIATYEEDKTIGLDQKLRIKTIDGKPYCEMKYKVPVYGLYGSEDNGNWISGMKEAFEALINAGEPAEIRCIEGKGHEIVSGAIDEVDAEIGNWLLSHR